MTNSNSNSAPNSKASPNSNSDRSSSTDQSSSTDRSSSADRSTKADPKSMTSLNLDFRIQSLIAKERELLINLLSCLVEAERRKLYLDYGFPSLFEYLKSKGYDGGSAQRRIDAVRLILEIPEVAEKLENSELTLTQVSVIQKAARFQSRDKSKSELRKLKCDAISACLSLTKSETQQIVGSLFDLPAQYMQLENTQADASVRVEITLSQEQRLLLKQAQESMSHVVVDGNLADVIEHLCRKFLSKANPSASVKRNVERKVTNGFTVKLASKEFSVQSNSKDSQTAAVAVKKSILSYTNSKDATAVLASKKSITTQINLKESTAAAAVKESVASQINLRNSNATTAALIDNAKTLTPRKRQLVLQTADGCAVCGSKWQLQVDHVQPRWAGGGHEIPNLQVLCGTHNRAKYRGEAGIRLDRQ